jgi:hypothetical protein
MHEIHSLIIYLLLLFYTLKRENKRTNTDLKLEAKGDMLSLSPSKPLLTSASAHLPDALRQSTESDWSRLTLMPNLPHNGHFDLRSKLTGRTLVDGIFGRGVKLSRSNWICLI